MTEYEKEQIISRILYLAEVFASCKHRNIQADYYHGDVEVREKEKNQARHNEITSHDELEDELRRWIK